jgi:subtilisin family serine protease
MKLPKVVTIATIAALAVAAGWLARRALRPGSTIAILDTGIDLQRAPELRSSVRSEDSRNFWEPGPDVRDESGHGTDVALKAHEACPRCRLLIEKITRHGAGVRASDLSAAIDYAVARGACVINLSAGVVSPGGTNAAPDERALAASVAAAEKAGTLVVAAAGIGVPNPFRPAALSTFAPQRFAETFVVGRAREHGLPDELGNFGPELDLSVEQAAGVNPGVGSSFAAAEVSGIAAALDSGLPLAELRCRLRQATAPAAPSRDVESRVGFGVLSRGEPPGGPCLGARANQGFTRVWVNSAEPLTASSAEWSCPSRPPERAAFEIAGAKPGLLVLAPKGAPEPACKLKLTLTNAVGTKRELEVAP